MSRRRRSRSGPLTPEQRERFWARERKDAATWRRLTPKQRQQPYWRRRAAQWQNAASIGIASYMAGAEPPEPVLRYFDLGRSADQPIAGHPSGLFEPVLPHPVRGAPWGSAWGSPWCQPARSMRD